MVVHGSDASEEGAVVAVLTGEAYWELMQKVAARVDKWPAWKTGVREDPMNQEIFTVVQSVQEIMMSMDEEDQYVREVMRTTARTEDLLPHFRMLRYYAHKLKPLLDAFELATFKECQEEFGEVAESK